MNGRLAALRLPLAALTLFALWLLTLPVGAQEGVVPTTPNVQATINSAWQLAQQSGTYHYRSRVAQTNYPAPSLTNAGRSPTESAFGVEGWVDLPAETLEMTLWRDGSFDPQRGVAMRIEGEQAYGRVGEGEWEKVQDISEVFAPGGDPLGFLAGVKAVTMVGQEERDLGQGDLTLRYTRYTFEVDGAAFGDYMRERVAERMRANGELPAGVALETPQLYRDMGGTGEIWLTEAGLPARLTMQIELPDPQSGSRTTATITNDYWGFDTARISQGGNFFWQTPTAWLATVLPQSDFAWLRTATNGMVLLSFVAIVVMSLRIWRLKQFYVAVVGAVILSMLLSPLMQGGQAYAFRETVNRQSSDQAAERAAQEEEAAGVAEAHAAYQPDWNPHRDPLATLSPATQAALANLEALQARQQAPLRQSTTTTDSDGDGLSDADEEVWGSCPASGSPSDYCVGVTDPTDTDGDGFEDGTEVNQLASLPSRADSDGDGISDWLEVKGFTYNGTQWYLNPNEEDSNYDGYSDGYECAVWSSLSGSYNAGAICPDTDRDGSPDLFDSDNDGDGVVDDADLSPNQSGGETFNDSNPLELKLTNLQTNQPVVLTLQFRPTAGNISHQALVLDWPSGDEAGHIQRQLDTTFATTTDPDSQSSDILAGNGDVRLTPLLEITMPYTTGHYANLPVNSNYAGTNRTLGVAVDEWLDADALELYGVDLQDVDETSGDLVAYLPLGTDTSNQGDEAVAFNARMLYYPTQGSNGVATWGEAQQFRLLWLVQMLQDRCINEADDPDTCEREESLEVIHVYQDEWTLSGLQVSEEGGTDVAVLYENPTLDDNLKLDDHLWNVSWNLSNTFLQGRDCDTLVGETCQSDGNRDVTIANLATTIDGWSSGTQYVEVATFAGQYEHQHEALAGAAGEMQTLLTDTFAAYTTSTAPTLLLATEYTARTVNLADSAATINNGAVTLNFNSTNVLPITSVGLNWQPYHYVDGEWSPYDIEDYLSFLDIQVQNDAFFQPEDESSTAAEEVEGKRLWAQYYYTLLYQGLTTLVEMDGSILWTPSDSTYDVAESSYEATVLDVSLIGFTFIGGYYGFIAIEAVKAAAAGKSISQTIWSGMLRDGSTYGFGKSALVGTALMAGIFITAVIGIGLYVAGYLTGNGTLVEIGRWVLTITAILSPTIWLITMLVQVVQAVQAGIAAGVGLVNMFRAVVSVSNGFPVFPAVMLVITIAITLIMFIYALCTMDLKNDPASAYALAAYTLASIYVQLLIFAIGLIPIIGQIIVVLLLITDAILMILGKQSVSAWLTEQIAKGLFDYDTFLKLDDPERLEFSPAGSELLNDDLGFAITNGVTYSLQVTNTMEADDYKNKNWAPDSTEPNAWQAIKYSTFRYFLKNNDGDEHSSLRLYQMEDEWEKLSNNRGRTVQTATGAFQFASVGTGINRNFGGAMYLVESYAASYVLCLELPTRYITLGFADEVCTWHRYNGSNPINVGEYVEYDILPATVSEFADVQRWNNGSIAFPQQMDQDGDGLLSQAQGGVDINDLVHDTDNDGLSDAYEAAYGTQLDDADSDGDGLNDAEELEALTDPFDADSDRDGLSDYTELVEGWVYAFPDETGSYIKTRVWSNPLNSDADNDTLSDLEEFVFGSHPQVATDPSFIKDLIRFDSLTIEEDSSMELLARFKEGQGVTAFADLSGNDNHLTCTLNTGSCPTAGATGRYGDALQFDGGDYLDTGSAVLELGKHDFTISAWVKTTGTKMAIVTKSDGDSSWESGEKSFYLNETGRPTFVGWGNSYIRSTVAVNDGQWHHVAVVWDYAGSGSAGTGRMYVDGADVSTNVSYTANNNDGATHTFRIAHSNQNVNEAQNNFNGTLDEVVAFSSALSANEIVELVGGRYNPADLVVVPDATLTYQAVVTNTHATQGSDGLLSADTQFAEPEIVDPQLFLRFEDEDQILSFINGVGDSATATCLGDGTCPDYEATGKYGNGVAFDGNDDRLTIPTLANGAATQTLAFWLKVDSLPASGQQATILDTTGTANGALDIYLNSDGNLVFDIQGAVSNEISYCPGNTSGSCAYTPWTGDHVSDYSFSGNLGTWVHFIWLDYGSQSRIYINGTRDYWDSLVNYTTLPTLVVAPGTMGDNASGTAPLDATLDEFVFYNETVQSSTSLSTLRPFELIRDGSYWIALTVNNISDHVPSFLLTFNEDPSYDPLVFDNTTGNDLTCPTAATCPSPDYSGNGTYNEAIAFDGVNDYLPMNGEFTVVEMDISLDIKVASLPASGQVATLFDYGSETGLNARLYGYLNSSGQVVVNFWQFGGGSYGTAVASTTTFGGANLGVWKSLKMDFTYSPFFDNMDYVLTVNGVQDVSVTDHWTNLPDFRFGGGRIGNNESGSSPYHGSLDNFIITNNNSGSASKYNLTFEIESARDFQYINHATDGKITTCIYVVSCPTLDSNGAVGGAIAFDGGDFLVIDDTDFARGDYTIGFWFKSSSNSQQALLSATNTATAQNGILLELQANGTLRYLHRFPTASSGGAEVISPLAYNNGQWHYATAVYEDTLLRLFVDGVQVGATQNSADTTASTLLDVTLGRLTPLSHSRYLVGGLDELTLLPAATDADGIALLMADLVPAMVVADDFIPFSAAPLAGTEVSGTISVDSDAPTSVHRFEEEVEAALQLSQEITIPVIDDRAANLLFFLPFEEVPASTTFENVVSAVEQVCSGSHCPVAGVRGKVDRAAYFDGVDDYINTYQTSETSAGDSGDVVSIAVWVKADQGTILDMTSPTIGQDYGGTRLTTNRLDMVFEAGSVFYYYDLPITLPENEWAHLVTTYDSSSKVASVYVNGALQSSETFSNTGNELENRRLRIGLNKSGLDALHGYLDDLRMYDVALSAAEVQSLYLESASILRFEFDEDSSATVFADSSINGYTGVPTLTACVPFELNTLTVNSSTTAGRDLYAYFEGARFIQESAVTAGSTFALNRTWTVCGGEKLEVGFIESNGSATSVGSYTISAANVASVAASTTGTPFAISSTMSSGGNSISIVGALYATPTYQPNPAPGTDGQIGNTALFDGVGAIEVESASVVNALTNDFTVIGWINPEQLNGTQQIFAAGQDNSSNGFSFGVVNDKLRFSRIGGSNYNGTTSLDANVWQQVAIVFDSGNDAHFYVDGILQTTVTGSTAVTANSDDPWYVGATTTSAGVLTQQFTGQIDELSLYSRALTAEEIVSVYLRELRWYRARATDYLSVDNDLPTIELLTPDGSYYKDGYIQLAVTAADVGSDVELIDFGIKAPGEANFTWSNAPLCVDASRSGDAWCPYFTSSGEGTYTFKFRAVDSVGNEAFSDEYTLYVDDTAPTATSAHNGEWQELVADPNVKLSWTVALSGTVSDPTLAGGIPGSGVYSGTITVALVDDSGKTLNETPQIATLNGTLWSLDYQIDGIEPAGKYTLWVTAEDTVGNAGSSEVGAIQLDGRESQAELDYWTIPDIITDTITLNGTINEQPAWAGLVAQFHLEESGSEFYDGSYYAQHAECSGSSCPTAGSGQFGQARNFDGIDDGLVVMDVLTDGSPIDLDTLAIALWVNPTQAAGASGRGLIVKGDGSDNALNYALYLAPNGYTVGFTADDASCSTAIGTLTTVTPLTPNVWSHVAVIYDGATARIYLNGVEDATAEWSGALCQNNHPIRIGDGGTLASFAGRLDEVRLFDRALSDREIYALAQSIGIGVDEVEIALVPLDLESEAVDVESLTWNSVEVDNPDSPLSTWDFAIPADTPEDYYSIYLRGRDAYGNESGVSGVWRGAIDQEAPRLTFTASTYGSGATQYTDYEFEIEDILLDPASIEQICGTTGLQYRYHTGTEVYNGATGSCRVPGTPDANATLTACDFVGHCNTITISTPTTRFDASVIIEPHVGETFIGLEAIEISGMVFSADGVQSLDVTVDGETIYTETWSSGVLFDGWSTTWTAPQFGSYELEAILTTYDGTIVIDPFTNRFTVSAPQLVLSKSATPNSDLQLGDGLTYTLILSNTGDLTATNVLVTDLLPEGVSGTDLSETVTVTAGSFVTFTIPATITEQLSPVITNTAYFTHTWEQGVATATLELCDVALVTNANDSGPGSLRQAIADVCAPALITFADDYSIYLNSPLTLNKDITLDASGHEVTLSGDSGNDGDRDVKVMTIAAGNSVTITHMSVVSGTAGSGGGISNDGTLTLIDSVVADNYASNGNTSAGGIYNIGTLILENTTFYKNSAGLRGGAIYSTGTISGTGVIFEQNQVRPPFGLQRGGALFNDNGAHATFTDSTFIQNNATQGGAIYQHGILTLTLSSVISNTSDLGGGIYNWGSATVENSTFAGNAATNTTYGGGGIFNNLQDSTITVTQSTFVNNSSGHEGGGIYNYINGYLILQNTLLANNSGNSDCFDFGDDHIVSTVASLVEVDSDCNATLTGNAYVGTIGDYGGSQWTAPLLPGSPAIDAGDALTCTVSDSRGVARVGVCDIGAFESQGFALAYADGSNQSTPVDSDFAEPLHATVSALVATEAVAGGIVSFTAPDSGAGLVQTTYTATLDLLGNGAATVTANNETGSYTVTATTKGAPESAFYTLTNLCNSSSYVVTNDNDDGAGSLRRAIGNTCAGGTITFAADLTIYLSSTLTIDKSLTIDGSGVEVVISGDSSNDGSANVRLFTVTSGSSVTLRHITLTDGYSDGNGGAILNQGALTLDTVTVEGNHAEQGAGVMNDGSATALIIRNSTFANNSATENGGAILNNGSATISNSTFSGNSGFSTIFNDATLTLNSSTIADSSEIGVSNAGTLLLRNSIIAGSEAADCLTETAIATNSHTLIEDGSCSPTFEGDPLLAPLADYGGDTHTHALLPGSPALNTGDGAICSTTDQRGVARYGICDIGAFESQGFTLAYLNGSEQRTSINSNFPNPLRVQLTANVPAEPVGGGGEVQYLGPTTGASITPTLSIATTDGSGVASLTALANEITGSYQVTATVGGGTGTALYTLENYDCANPLVNNGNDSGLGSLRQAITDSCAGAHITFDGDYAIYLNSFLSINKELTIDGSGQAIVVSGDSNNDGTRNVQPFRIGASGVVTITHLSVISGTTGNTGGGAILNQGDLRVYNSLFQNNHSTTGAGGGAILSTNKIAVYNSTFYTNTAEIGGGLALQGTAVVVNSTFAHNSVAREGGAINTLATLTLTNNTIANNSAFIGTGIYNRSGGGVLNWNNNILANNGTSTSLQCWNFGSVSGGNNLSNNGLNSCGATSSATLTLSALGNYGGDTPTYALPLGSSAIDAGNSTLCAASPVNGFDQRGEVRSAACDVGAFEAHFTLTVTGGDGQSTNINTPFAQPLELTITGLHDAPVGTNGNVTFTTPTEGAGLSGNANDSPDSNGLVTVNVNANGVAGSYVVTATTTGADAPALFALTNTGFVTIEDVAFNVDEDAPNGTELGNVPTDNQTGNPITYQVTDGNEDGVFAIDDADGTLTIADNSTLDYENVTEYLLEVSAGDGTLTDTATVTISVNNLFADLSIEKEATPNGTPAGEPLTYTLTFYNEGREVASGVVITDFMPAEVTVLGSEVDGDDGVTITLSGTNPYRWIVSDLAPGVGGVITITTEVNGDVAGGEIINTAQIGATDEENDNDDNEATVFTPLCFTEMVVGSDVDEGEGSLREAVGLVCEGGTVTFANDMIITLESYLPVEKSMTIDGNGYAVTISGDAGVRGDIADNVTVFELYSEFSATITLRGLIIRDGNGEGAGGVAVSPSVVAIIEDSWITQNRGSGVANYGTLFLENSTVSDNYAYWSAAVDNGYEATATIRNSTITNNRTEADGGGVANWYGNLTIINSTIISNTANSDGDDYGSGGGLYYGGTSLVTVTNSIIAGNVQVDLEDNQVLNDSNCYRDTEWEPTPPMVDGGYNMVGDNEDCVTDSGTTITISRAALFDTVLEPLDEYGGATPTHALQNGAPAIDLIPLAACDVADDQRGQPRGTGKAQGGSACDVGAYEAFSTDELAGDVSCDSVMNTVDGLFALQFDDGLRGAAYTCGLAAVTLHLPSCDANQDGICNADDATALLQCDVGLDNSFCPATPRGGATAAMRLPIVPQRGGAIITLGNGIITEDETEVTLPITLTIPGESNGALNIVVSYDATKIDVAGCAANPNGAFDAGFCSFGISGQVTFNGVTVAGVSGSDVVVGTITFRRGPPVVEDVTIPLPIAIQTFTDPLGETISVSGVPGQLTIESIPLAVTLAEFTATAHPNDVLVAWETASEVDNLGFNLLRATTPNIQAAIQLNDELILSQSPGGGQGAFYEWHDVEVNAGTTYWYWLESVDIHGNITRFAPVTVTYGNPTALTLVEFGSAPPTPFLELGMVGLMIILLGMIGLRRR